MPSNLKSARSTKLRRGCVPAATPPASARMTSAKCANSRTAQTFVKTRPTSMARQEEGIKGVHHPVRGGAHLNGVAGDDRLANVAWLCRACHLRHDLPQ